MTPETFVPDLDDAAVLARLGTVLRQALTIRLAERRLLELFSEGKLFGTVHTCIGQEFTGPAFAAHLQPHDTVFSNHRCHGHFLAVTDELDGLIAEVMGRASGVCGGFGGSQHLHLGRFYSNGVQGGITPVAAGLALAHQRAGSGAISVVCIGDGTLGEGVLYETLNLAAKWQLPLLVIVEDNAVAQSTPRAQTLAGSIAARFEAFGIPVAQGSTWQWDALHDGLGASVRAVREGRGPRVHVVETYRLMAHSKGDDDRPRAEVEAAEERDPLTRLLRERAGHPWLEGVLAEAQERVAQATARAEAAPFGALPQRPAPARAPKWAPAAFARQRVVTALNEVFAELLAADAQTMLFGEDLESPYGGAFKVSAGLSERFAGRVRNTPISEAAIVGLGNGLALAGQRPYAEIMFGDFITLATDQWINHAAKFAGMYGSRVAVPLTVRAPMGGHRGYGPTHSQSLEALWMGQPGTRVLALHHRASPAALYRALAAAPAQPTLVVENKLLYAAYADPAPPAGFALLHSDDRFPTAWLKPEGDAEITLLCAGGLSVEAERAVVELLQEHEVLCDLLLPSALYPFDVATLEASLTVTGRLLVVEEGQGFAGFGAEVLAQLAEHATLRSVRAARLHAAPWPIPSARPLEQESLPQSASIVTRVLEVLRG